MAPSLFERDHIMARLVAGEKTHAHDTLLYAESFYSMTAAEQTSLVMLVLNKMWMLHTTDTFLLQIEFCRCIRQDICDLSWLYPQLYVGRHLERGPRGGGGWWPPLLGNAFLAVSESFSRALLAALPLLPASLHARQSRI